MSGQVIRDDPRKLWEEGNWTPQDSAPVHPAEPSDPAREWLEKHRDEQLAQAAKELAWQHRDLRQQAASEAAWAGFQTTIRRLGTEHGLTKAEVSEMVDELAAPFIERSMARRAAEAEAARIAAEERAAAAEREHRQRAAEATAARAEQIRRDLVEADSEAALAAARAAGETQTIPDPSQTAPEAAGEMDDVPGDGSGEQIAPNVPEPRDGAGRFAKAAEVTVTDRRSTKAEYPF